MKLKSIMCHQPVWTKEINSNETVFGDRGSFPATKNVIITANDHLISVKSIKTGAIYVIPWANVRIAEQFVEAVAPANNPEGAGEQAGSTSVPDSVAGVPQAKRSTGRKGK